MANHKLHKQERSLLVIKPDGIQRSLIGEIIQRFERVGLKLVGLKMFVPTPEFVKQHYTLEEGWIKTVGAKLIKGHVDVGKKPFTEDPEEAGKSVLEHLQKYITAGPVVVMAWQGAHAAAIVKKLVGSTEPLSSDVGTIRGDYVLDSFVLSNGDNRATRNIVHCAGNKEEAEREISHWFKDEELLNYNLAQDKILYDVNLDGILE